MHNQLVVLCYILQGILFTMGNNDRLKDAASHFLLSSAILEQIKVELLSLNEKERTTDFSDPNLKMCSCVAKAQVQYCAFEKVKRTSLVNTTILSQLAMQASELYGKAYTQSLSLPKTNLKNFISILNYNKHSFVAQANYWVGQQYTMGITQSSINIVKTVS
jgi:hypothetical protein